MNLKDIMFWQPKKDYFKYLTSFFLGKKLIVFLNYIIWIFLFYISFLLVRYDYNNFWKLLIVTVLSEIIEKCLKKKNIWSRPVHKNKNEIPSGLMKTWYSNGSFPSGHTIKALFFFLFIIQYQVFSPILYWLVVFPLLSIRVLVGFHYPIDVLGGAVIGIFLWYISLPIRLPPIFNNIIGKIFNLVFYGR